MRCKYIAQWIDELTKDRDSTKNADFRRSGTLALSPVSVEKVLRAKLS